MKYGREWNAGLCVGILVGVSAGWIASTWPGLVVATSAKHWWDIGTAIGTVSTAGATAWLTYRNWRQTQREKARRAEMALARVTPELHALRQAAMIGVHAASMGARVEEGAKLPAWLAHTFEQVLGALEAPVAGALEDLAFEESDRGKRLALIVARIRTARRWVSGMIQMGEKQPNGGEIQAYLTLMCLAALGRAIEEFFGKPVSRMFLDAYHEKLRNRLGLSEFAASADEL